MKVQVMTGKIVRVVEDKGYGFVRFNDEDWFFHKSDFMGNWDDLVEDFRRSAKASVEVTFEEGDKSKGRRAANVTRTDESEK